jgi:D-sedoheptulose 7-phosphate isomerase
MNTLDRLFQRAGSFGEYARGYMDYCASLMAGLDLRGLERFVEILEQARLDGRTIFFAGNGGSAATASHFATDLALGVYVPGERPFRAVSLADNVAYLSALGNDQGYEHVFVGQLQSLFRPGDVLVLISASGASPNVVRAAEYVNARGGMTVGLVGFGGGELRRLCQHCVHVETPAGEYGPVEDLHLIVDHLVTTYLLRRLRGHAQGGQGSASSQSRP